MVTIKEKVIVSQDDAMLSEYRKLLKKEDGWKIIETTMTVEFRRERYIGAITLSK